MYLLKQRLLGGGDKEPEAFLNAKKDCLAMREGLKSCEKAVKAWMDGAHKMSDAAARLAEFSGPDPDLLKLGTQVSVELGPTRTMKACKEAMESIELKVKLLDKLSKECSELDDRRLVRNRLLRKTEEANKSSKADAATKEKVARDHEEAVHAHDTLFAELSGSFDFILQEAGGHGGTGLARPEMRSFKRSTVRFFSSCNAICQKLDSGGDGDANVDLATEWRDFNNRRDAVIEKARQDHTAATATSAATIGGAAAASGQLQPPPPPLPSGSSSALPVPPGPLPTPPVASAGAAQPPPPPPPAPALAAVPALAPVPVVAPTPAAALAHPQARALYDYTPEKADELAIKEGDILSITKQEDDGWWAARSEAGATGLVPSNYCEMIDDDYESEGAV